MPGLTLETMRADVAELLEEDPSQIGDDDNLVDFGLDSMRLMALATRWRSAGANVRFADLAERPQLTHWFMLVERGGTLAP
jgi:bifunctional isochorismate lyase/aryl carrier protein